MKKVVLPKVSLPKLMALLNINVIKMLPNCRNKQVLDGKVYKTKLTSSSIGK